MALARASGAYKNTHRELCKLVSDTRLVLNDFEVKEEDSRLEFDSVNSEEGSSEVEGDTTSEMKKNHRSRKISALRNRSHKLEEALKDSNASRDAAVARVAMLEETNGKLRELIKESFRSGEQNKYEMRQAQSFFRSLDGNVENIDALLKYSEPPSSFEAYKVEASHATEIDTLKARLKQSQAQVSQLQNRVEALTRSKENKKSRRNQRLQQTEQLLASKHSQVLGAVRRIQYLLEQNERQQDEIAKKDTYIARLEDKLLEINKELNNLRAKTIGQKPLAIGTHSTGLAFGRKIGTPQPKKTINQVTVESPEIKVNWQSVFEQGSLGKSPSPKRMTGSLESTQRSPSPLSMNATDELFPSENIQSSLFEASEASDASSLSDESHVDDENLSLGSPLE